MPDPIAETRAREEDRLRLKALATMSDRHIDWSNPVTRVERHLAWLRERDPFERAVPWSVHDLAFMYALGRTEVAAEVVEAVKSLDSFVLDRGRGYGCQCEMKREQSTQFYAADWLDRDETIATVTRLAEATEEG